MTVNEDTPQALHKDTPQALNEDTPQAPDKDTPQALHKETPQAPGEDALLALARDSLDGSVENLDAATLSQLNQARQRALESAPQPWLSRVWLPMGAAGFAVLALAIALPLLQPREPLTPQLNPVNEESYQAAAQDMELVEDLDLVLWLMDAEDHAS
ncbi:MAG: hypothetical protein ABJ308_16275 [Halieaceae bacterium]